MSDVIGIDMAYEHAMQKESERLTAEEAGSIAPTGSDITPTRREYVEMKERVLSVELV